MGRGAAFHLAAPALPWCCRSLKLQTLSPSTPTVGGATVALRATAKVYRPRGDYQWGWGFVYSEL